MRKFNLRGSSGDSGYAVDILDIWCQGNKVVAYVQGSSIYKTEMIIREKRISNYYCSCPSGDGGMNFCKHLSGVESYLKKNAIFVLEDAPIVENKIDYDMSVKDIRRKLEKEINKIVDDDGWINCYNSEKFGDIVSSYCKYLEYYIDNENYDKAACLVIEICNVVLDTSVMCEDDYDDTIDEIVYFIENILDKICDSKILEKLRVIIDELDIVSAKKKELIDRIDALNHNKIV